MSTIKAAGKGVAKSTARRTLKTAAKGSAKSTAKATAKSASRATVKGVSKAATKRAPKGARKTAAKAVSSQLPPVSAAQAAAAKKKFERGILARGEAVPKGMPLPPGATHEIVGTARDGTPILKRKRFSIT